MTAIDRLPLPRSRGFAAIAASALLAGCATPPSELVGMSASPAEVAHYAALECDALAKEATIELRKIREFGKAAQEQADTDQTQTAVGVILFWPALFFLEGSETPENVEFRRHKGRYDALRDEMGKQECSEIPDPIPTDRKEFVCFVKETDPCPPSTP